MRTGTNNRLMDHMMTIAMTLFIAAVILLCLPAKVHAAGLTGLCATNINNYNDGKWHYAGRSGSPTISGWKSGGFMLSTDRATMSFDNFVYTNPDSSASTTILEADRSMTVVFKGTNKFGQNDFASLGNSTGEVLYDLTIQGDSGSYAEMGNPGFGNMMTVRNLSVSGCTFSSDANIYLDDGIIDVKSGLLRVPTLRAGDMNISGGTIYCLKGLISKSDITQSGGTLFSDDYVKAYGSYYGTKGILRADSFIETDADMIVSGATQVAAGGLDVAGNLSLYGNAQLTAESYDNFMTIVARNVIVSENAILKASAENGPPLSVSGITEIRGGQIESISASSSLDTNDLTVTGGTITGKGGYTGIDVKGSAVISGGTVYGESQNGSGIYFRGDAKIRGGIIKAKRGTDLTEECSAIKGSWDKIGTTGDIWISTPSDGYLRKYGDNSFGVFDADGNLADEAVMQKVTGVSIGTRPTSIDDLYEGDAFDPDGTVFRLHFEDGSEADYSWNTEHAVHIGMNSIPDINELNAGNKVLTVGCFGGTTKLYFTVKQIGTPVLNGSVSGTTANLNWTKADGARKYRVFVGETGSGSSSSVGNTTNLSFSRRGLEPGKTYDFTVWASRNSDSYAKESNVVTLTIPISAPVLNVSETGYDSTKLSWRASTGADQYEIYKAKASDTADFKKIATVSGLSLIDSGLVTGTEYIYYAVAVNSNSGVRSAKSNRISVTPEFDGAATIESVVNNGSGYELNWTKVAGATGYEIRRGTGTDGKRTLIATTDTISYTDSTADIYTVYNYTVTPVRSSEESTLRGEESNIAVTEAAEKPAPVIVPQSKEEPAPAIVPPSKEEPDGTIFNLLQARSGKVTKSSIQIKWKRVAGAKNYVVYGNKCGTRNKYKKLVTTPGTSNVFAIVAGKRVTKGTYFKFIVYAVDGNGKVISISKTVHVATKGGKVGNDKRVKTAAKKNKVSLKMGKKFRLKAKSVPASRKLKVKRHRKIAYETSNDKIAAVSSKGVITAKGRGTCYVYAYTQNGVFAKIKVTVK